jgi:copper transport protein
VILAGVCAAFVALLVGPAAALAQEGENSLQSIEPPNGSSVGTAPTEIVLVFNQELDDEDAPTLVLRCGADIQATGLPSIDADRLVVTVPIESTLPRDACIVDWLLRDGDGEVIASGSSTFNVTADAPTTTAAAGSTGSTSPTVTIPAGPPSEAAEPATENAGSVGGAIWLGRLLSTLGILVVFGGLALISVGWPEGPEYVVTVRFLRAMWVLAMLGTILYLIAYTADFRNASFGSAINPTTWLDLNDDGWTGRGALLRLVFIGGSGWVAMRPERIIDPQSAMWAWAIPGLALVAVSMSRVDGPAPILGLLVGIVHVVAVAVWLGGAALVARVVLAGPGEEDLVQATRAFSRISVPAMLVAIVTGVIQLIRLDGADLFGSSHGQVLLLKVVAVAAMLAVAIAARQQVTLRLDRAQEMTSALADRFKRAFGAEAALGVVALAFSGWLLALTPPSVDPLAGESYAIELPYNDETSGLEATVFVGPSRVGMNGMKIEVEAPADGITNLVLRFLPPAGADAFGYEVTVPLTTSGTAWIDDDNGMNFTVAGEWTLELSASTATGVIEDAEHRFTVVGGDGDAVASTTTVATSGDVGVTVIDQTTTTAPFGTTTTVATTESTPEGG